MNAKRSNNVNHKILWCLSVCFMTGTALPAASAQTNDYGTGKAYQSWHGNFTGSTQPETLTLKDGDLYLYKGGAEQPQLVATLRGHNLGQGGLYVANLDGNGEGRQSVAFYNPDLNAWSWGTFDGATLRWEPVGENVGGKTMFHVKNGAAFYPIDQVEKVESSSTPTATPAETVVTAKGDPAPFSFPLLGSQYDALAPSQHVWTTFYLEANGDITAATRLKEDTLFAGFHTGASIELYAPGNFNVPLCHADLPSPIGVTGTFFGHSDVTVQWTHQCPSNVLPLLKYYAVVQKWSPDWYTVINDAGKLAKAVQPILQLLKTVGVIK